MLLSHRTAGVLLHPTSLPGSTGIGEIGPHAFDFIDFLAAAGQRCWQILPLGPTGFGDSPYQTFSSHAGNPWIISLEALRDDGLLRESEMADAPGGASDRVDFGALIAWKRGRLREAAARFAQLESGSMRDEFEDFRARHNSWLGDFVLFQALKEEYEGRPWIEWDPDLVHRRPLALAAARERLSDEVAAHRVIQFFFRRQWNALRKHAASRGIRIIGDLPIFVAYDSADVWSDRDWFWLDADGRPTVVAGVPPDAFSETGQLWGNPLYHWPRLQRYKYAWWITRMRSVLEMVDAVRLDHFIGLTRYWEIPVDSPTAMKGRWVPGPGAGLLAALRDALGNLPLIAEDLGVVTTEVEALREKFELPGMKVLQFAFDGNSANPYLPHQHSASSVVYTGTHDNDTTEGWFASLTFAERQRVEEYFVAGDPEPSWQMIRMAHASVAKTAIIPMQDALSLGSSARMNRPGIARGNWAWRVREDQLTPVLAERLRRSTTVSGRLGN